MIVIGSQGSEPAKEPLLQAMFEARKQVFVDLLKWDVPVLDGRYEIDQFDDEQAVYLIVADSAGEHLGSARLLPTSGPHILDSLFPSLCAGVPPRGSDCLEITQGSHPSAPSKGRDKGIGRRIRSAGAVWASRHD